MLNRQEIYDKVMTHLFTQGAKSRVPLKWIGERTETNVCAYRGEGGLKCAAGVLIDDEHYSPSLEGVGVPRESDLIPRIQSVKQRPKIVLISDALNASGIPTGAFQLVRELQCLHDRYRPSEWAPQGVRLAIRNGLSPAVVHRFIGDSAK